jgi:hypothetical protein
MISLPPPPWRLCCNHGEERFGRDRQSGSSALESGHLEVRVIDVVTNVIFLRGCGPVADRYKGSALKLRHLTACPVLQRKWFFVDYDTVS